MPRDGGHQERLPGGTGMGQGFEKQTVVVWLRHSGVGITGRQNRRDRTYKNWRGQFGRPWAGHAPDGTASCLLDVSYQRAQCYIVQCKVGIASQTRSPSPLLLLDACLGYPPSHLGVFSSFSLAFSGRTSFSIYMSTSAKLLPDYIFKECCSVIQLWQRNSRMNMSLLATTLWSLSEQSLHIVHLGILPYFHPPAPSTVPWHLINT